MMKFFESQFETAEKLTQERCNTWIEIRRRIDPSCLQEYIDSVTKHIGEKMFYMLVKMEDPNNKDTKSFDVIRIFESEIADLENKYEFIEMSETANVPRVKRK